MNIFVYGSGAWGTALAMLLCDNGHAVTLWTHDPEKAAAMVKTRRGPRARSWYCSPRLPTSCAARRTPPRLI